MTTALKATLALAAVLALTACKNASPLRADLTDFNNRELAYSALLTAQQAEALTPTTALPLPTATYTGLAEMDAAGEIFLGTVSATANFTGGTLTGSVDDVISGTSGRFAGSLLMSAGAVDTGGATIGLSGDLDGTLTQGVRSVAVDAAFSGGFRGTAAQGFIADLDAGSTLTSGGITSTLGGTLVGQQ